MNYAYTNIKNLTINYIVNLGKFFKKLFFGKKKLKKLSTCIKNSLKWTNRNCKLIKILYIYIYIYICCGSIFKSVSFFETGLFFLKKGFIFSNSTVFAFLTITNYMNIFSNLN